MFPNGIGGAPQLNEEEINQAMLPPAPMPNGPGFFENLDDQLGVGGDEPNEGANQVRLAPVVGINEGMGIFNNDDLWLRIIRGDAVLLPQNPGIPENIIPPAEFPIAGNIPNWEINLNFGELADNLLMPPPAPRYAEMQNNVEANELVFHEGHFIIPNGAFFLNENELANLNDQAVVHIQDIGNRLPNEMQAAAQNDDLVEGDNEEPEIPNEN